MGPGVDVAAYSAGTFVVATLVAFTMSSGFRRLGQVLLRPLRWAKRQWPRVIVVWFAVVLFSALRNREFFVSLGILAFLLAGLVLSVATKRADEASRKEGLVANVKVDAELAVERARSARLEAELKAEDALTKLSLHETALENAEQMILAAQGVVALDRDAIVAAIQTVAERLVGTIEGMTDPDRARSLLDCAEQLRILCGELEDDRATETAVAARMSAIHHTVLGRLEKAVTEMTKQVVDKQNRAMGL